MAHTEPLAQQNPVSPDGLLRWNGRDWVLNPIDDNEYAPEKLTTLTETEKNQLATGIRPEELGWYPDPLSDGSTARLWSGSEWTAIVRRKLESATPIVSGRASGQPEPEAGVPSSVKPSEHKQPMSTPLTEAEEHQLADAAHPEKMGWYPDPLSDGSSLRAWSGSEWTAIVRHKLKSATSAPDPSEPTDGGPSPVDVNEYGPTVGTTLTEADRDRLATAVSPGKMGWSTKKKLIAWASAIVFVLIGLVAVGASGANSNNGDSSSGNSSSTDVWDTADSQIRAGHDIAGTGSERAMLAWEQGNMSGFVDGTNELSDGWQMVAEGFDMLTEAGYKSDAVAHAARQTSMWWGKSADAFEGRGTHESEHAAEQASHWSGEYWDLRGK